MTALAIINKDSIIAQMAEGRRVSEIAKQLGITPEAIYQNLSSDPEYQKAKVTHHAVRLDQAELGLEEAQDQLSLARAREVHKAYAWRASVECSRIWGNQSSIATSFGQSGITINIGTVDQAVTIDGETVKD